MINKASIIIGGKDIAKDKVLFMGKELTQDEIDIVKQIKESNKIQRDKYSSLPEFEKRLDECHEDRPIEYPGKIRPGDYVRVHRPKDFLSWEDPYWISEMDKFDNKLVRVNGVDQWGKVELYFASDDKFYWFHPDWCKKFAEHDFYYDELLEESYELGLPFDWDKIPNNFSWIAIDEDGSIWAYSSEPEWFISTWKSESKDCSFIRKLKINPIKPELLKYKRPE